MYLISILGTVSALIGIVGFFFPAKWKNSFAAKVVFTVILIVLTVQIINQNDKLVSLEKTSRAAYSLLKQKQMEFTHEGFILAALSFFERNKQSFPESYERAKAIFAKYKLMEDRSTASIYVSSEMAGLVRGIAIMSEVDVPTL